MIEISSLADAIRPFWLRGLNEISGHCKKELKGWINDEAFQVYVAPTETSFTLAVSEPLPLLKAYAAEINRVSTASNETVASILTAPLVKKSVAWLIIQTYYAAFFAAHGLIRLLGTSCLPLESRQLRSVEKISKLFGQEPSGPIGGGLYQVTFDSVAKEIRACQLKSMKAGPHEAFWRLFCEHLENISSKVLQSPTLTTASSQGAAGKLTEITSNLRFGNTGQGAWLSSIRNRVNYDQSWATWYPYSERQTYYDDLVRRIDEWQLDPMDIDLVSHQDHDLRRFQATCNAIMALTRSTIEDMANRCSAGKSFHDFGSLAFQRMCRSVARTT